MTPKSKYRPIPPPPGDPNLLTLVRGKEGPHWRRKRGTVTPATLNTVFKKNNELAAITSPAAKRILGKLEPYTRSLETGRFVAKVSGRLIKAWTKNKRFDYSFMDGYDFQPYHPIYELFPLCPLPNVKATEIVLNIPIDNKRFKQLSDQITGYYIELVLLSGDPSKANSLRVQSDTSPLYTSRSNTNCKLSVSLPTKKGPWMVMIKVSSNEGNKPALHPRHYAMKVLRTGYV
jgi:hypothetical protein